MSDGTKQRINKETIISQIPAFFKVIVVSMIVLFYEVQTFNELQNVFTFSLLDIFDVNEVPK